MRTTLGDTTVSLNVAYGAAPEAALAEVILRLLPEKPDIVWCEPTPSRERLKTFPGLWASSLDGLEDHLKAGRRLEESRMFWPTGWTHLLTARAEVRWAAFYEGSDDPAWLKPLLAYVKGKRPEPWTGLRRERQTVLLLRDLKRYGLEGLQGRLPDELHIVTYHRGTDLIGWKLEK